MKWHRRPALLISSMRENKVGVMSYVSLLSVFACERHLWQKPMFTLTH